MNRPFARVLPALLAALLLPLPAAAQLAGSAQGEAEGGMLADEEGDVDFLCGGGCIGSLQSPNFVDIVRAGVVNETPESLVIQLELAGFSGTAEDAMKGLPGDVYYYVNLRFNGDDEANYGLMVSGPPGDLDEWYARRSWYTFYGDDFESDSEQMEPGTWSFTTEPPTLTATIDKAWFLLGSERRLPRAGDRVTWVDAYSSWDGLLVNFNDRVYGEVELTLALPTPNTLLALRFLRPDPPAQGGEDDEDPAIDGDFFAPDSPYTKAPVSLEGGKTKALPILVENGDARRRIVNLTGAVVGADGAPLAGWKVRLPPNLAIGPAASVTANAVVTAPANGVHGEGGILRLKAMYLGNATFFGSASRPVAVAASLTPEASRLWFHSLPDGRVPGLVGPALGPEYAPNPLRLSPLQADARYADPAVDLAQEDFEAVLDIVTPAALVLGEKGDITLSLHFSADRDRSLVADAEVYVYDPEGGGGLGFGESRDIQLPAGDSDVTWTFEVGRDEFVLPAGAVAEVFFDFQEGFFLPPTPGVRLVPSESFLELPVSRVEPDYFVPGAGDWLPQLNLAKDESREEFVNPGDSVAFNLTLVNAGRYADTIDLQINGSRPGWDLQIVPGYRFALEPGQAVNVGFQVRASTKAAEGDTFDVGVRAVSKNAPKVVSEVGLRLLVTEEIPLENETFTVSSEAVNATHHESKKDSPAPGPLVSIAGVLAAAVALRRRRAPT